MTQNGLIFVEFVQVWTGLRSGLSIIMEHTSIPFKDTLRNISHIDLIKSMS